MARIEFASTGFWLVLVSGVVGCGPSGGAADAGGGGGGQPDAAPPGFPDARPLTDAGICVATSATATEATKPVDIIWVVDTSGSMDDEASEVQSALNDFSSFIEAQGIDHHVILVGNAAAMSVPPPLGGSVRFRHVDQQVESHDAFEKLVQRYPDYQDFLRDNAIVHIVIVSDDESDWSASTFNSQLATLTDPGFPNGYTLHAICSEATVLFMPPPPLPPILGPCFGGLGAGGAAAPGTTYITMAAATGGLWRSICSSDWAPIFTAVATAVSIPVALPCAYDIPEPPQGEVLDPMLVNLAYTPTGGMTELIPQVANATACTGEGWFYDDPVAPTRILVCPSTCGRFEGDATGTVDIQFGCGTVID